MLSQFFELDKIFFKGLLLKSGGIILYMVIFVCLFNIFILVGVEIEVLILWCQQMVYIDGNVGVIVVVFDEFVICYYQQEVCV